MDAQDRKIPRRSWTGDITLGALVVIVVLCLWQGYGAWLLGEAGAHGG